MSEPTNETVVDKYVKLPDPAMGEVAEVKLRLLEWPGIPVFQHWIGPDAQHLRPYNCPSRRAGCPACAERFAAKLKGEDHRNIHRMSKKTFVNALDLSTDPKLKVFAMGPSVASAIETLTTRKGKEDPTTYDITLIKRKTGPEKFNVEYSVFFEEVRPLTKGEKDLADNLYSLTNETTTATNEVIGAAIKGQPIARYVDAETAAKVVALLDKQKMKLTDIDVADAEHIPFAKAEEVLKELG
jgi:hypothetical protein